MDRIVIIADDLTGANVTCSLLKKNGLDSISIMKPDALLGEEFDVLAYSTDTRGWAQEDAYRFVQEVIKDFQKYDVLFYNKRIDSTLRGNVGSEIDAFLDFFPEKCAVVVPAFPDSNRIAVKGLLLINGRPLEFSDAGRDPKKPTRSSEIQKIIAEQSQQPIAAFDLVDISKGEEFLTKKIRSSMESSRLLLFDAVTNEDIALIARVVCRMDLDLITVDPGPLTMYYANEALKKKQIDKKTLVIVGSTVPTIKDQIEEFLLSENVFLIKADPKIFFTSAQAEEEKKRIFKEVDLGIQYYDYILITTSPIGSEKPLDLFEVATREGMSTEEASSVISHFLSEVSVYILNQYKSFKTVYTCGGDITTAVLHDLGAFGIDIREELFPLVVYGKIIGGLVPNLNIISKGGMIGDKHIFKKSLNKINNYY